MNFLYNDWVHKDCLGIILRRKAFISFYNTHGFAYGCIHAKIAHAKIESSDINWKKDLEGEISIILNNFRTRSFSTNKIWVEFIWIKNFKIPDIQFLKIWLGWQNWLSAWNTQISSKIFQFAIKDCADIWLSGQNFWKFQRFFRISSSNLNLTWMSINPYPWIVDKKSTNTLEFLS